MLDARVAHLDDTCCPDGVASCPDGSPTECSVACGASLSPLMDECGSLLDVLFDAADGLEDGVADVFRSLLRKCNMLSPQEILAELQPLQAAGRCPDSWTEGVGATAVAAGTCADARPNCAQLTQLMTCAGDFCNTAGAACVMTGQCDKTCGFCSDAAAPPPPIGAGGHHRRQRRALQGEEHACPPDVFSTAAAAVTDACCDDVTGASCTDIPTECDARCGIVFVDFFARCSELLRVYGPADMPAYERLEATCAEELPVAPLLQLLGRCSDEEAICVNVDCGAHGTCTTTGTCGEEPAAPPTPPCTNTCESTPGWTVDANPVTTCDWVAHICDPMRRGECVEHGGETDCQWQYVQGGFNTPSLNCCQCQGFQVRIAQGTPSTQIDASVVPQEERPRKLTCCTLCLPDSRWVRWVDERGWQRRIKPSDL
eukprot:COSAG06_NODE_357_length_16856_cov_7.212687_2_plen_428_part_00